MDNEIMEAKVKATDEVGKLKAALRALSDPARAEVLRDMLPVRVLIPSRGPPPFIPTTTELDIEAIMQRVEISASVMPASGSVINVGENFTLRVDVYNGTHHNLVGAELRADGTLFASVVGPNVVELGDLEAYHRSASATATFQCQALTPTPSNPPRWDALIRLSVGAVLDFRGWAQEDVRGEVLPS